MMNLYDGLRWYLAWVRLWGLIHASHKYAFEVTYEVFLLYYDDLDALIMPISM